MFKELFNDTTTTLFGQISLVIFAIVFFAILIRTMLRPKQSMDRYAGLPLDDDYAAPRMPRTPRNAKTNSPAPHGD